MLPGFPRMVQGGASMPPSGGGAITITAGNFFGVIQGYGRPGGAVGAMGSISAQPVEGEVLDTLTSSAGDPTYNLLIFVGDQMDKTATLKVGGTTWPLSAPEYDNGIDATIWMHTPAAFFANGGSYSVEITLA